jgi:hypothetical protein
MADVLPHHSQVMAAVARRANRAAADALQDHHPVKAVEGAMVAVAVAVAVVVAKVVEGKVATAEETTSSRVAVSPILSPAPGIGASMRQRQCAGDGRNIACFSSPVPTSPALKNHLPDQAPASVGT